MPDKNYIGIVLLAAGSSSRMKHNKLLTVFEGVSLIERAVQAAIQSSATKMVVVTGANRHENESALQGYNIDTIHNSNWKNGIGSSIKKGLKYLMDNNNNLEATIISVCDQPFLNERIFNGLIITYKHTGKRIIASAYEDSYGVPVLYDQELFHEILCIPDQYGAKKYIIEKVSPEIFATFPFPYGEIDIDTPDDLSNLNNE